jgi:hypothetical protein
MEKHKLTIMCILHQPNLLEVKTGMGNLRRKGLQLRVTLQPLKVLKK